MFYHWLAPLGKTYIIFNLFNYISFRAAGATVTALLLAFVVGPPVIRRLRARKVGQVIRAEGPASHQSKRGTPTMGGLIILLATVVPTLLWAPLHQPVRGGRDAVHALDGVYRVLDDYLKIVQGKSRGLVAKWKLVGQCSFGLLLGLFLDLQAGGAGRYRFPPPPRRCPSSSTWWSTLRPGCSWCSSPS